MATRVTKTGSSSTQFVQAPQPLKIADLDADFNAIFSDIDNANIRTGAAITTAKLASDAGIITAMMATAAITTAKLADLGVTTAKLADLAVTTGKLAVAAAVAAIQSAVFSYGAINTTETNMVVLPSITTRGGRVVIFGMDFGVLTQGASAAVTLRLYRDAGVIKTWITSGAAGGGTQPFPIVPLFIEQPGPGSYVYKVTGQTGSVSLILSPGGALGTLFAMELA